MPEDVERSSEAPHAIDLLPHHRRQLLESGISDDVAKQRGYRSITEAADLLRIGFTHSQALVPALLIPIHNARGEVVLHQSRPDSPRKKANGKPIKYETPSGAQMVFDVPPCVRDRLGSPSLPLFVTEGAKKADAGASKGMVVIALLGVWSWRGTNDDGGKTALAEFESIAFNGRDVFIVFDSDVTRKSSVRKSLRRLAPFLKSRGAKVTILLLPEGPGGAKVGLDDFLASGRSIEDLRACREPQEADHDSEDAKASQAKLIVDLVVENYDLGVDPDGNGFAVQKSRPGIALMFKGSRKVLQGQIAAAFRRRFDKVTNSSAIADALMVLEGEAAEREPQTVHLRVAPDGQDIVLDLGRRDAKVVRITPSDWTLTVAPNILFRRTALTGELPVPERGGSLDDLGTLLNLSQDDMVLVQAWVVAALMPLLPHPILLLGGEQGTGKSCAAEFLVCIVDPSPSPRRSQPGNPRQWAVTAQASWGQVIDNISSIPEWLSDALCKAVTGDGWIDRALYTDAELVVLQYRRVIAMTSIHPGVLRGDLAERLLVIELEPIPETARRTESDLRSRYAAMRPQLLGAALTLLSEVLRELPGVVVEKLPRMADFAKVLAAIDAVNRTVRTDRTVALDAYRTQLDRLAEMVVDSDPVAEAVSQLIDGIPEWTGTATQFQDCLKQYLPSHLVPKTARAMSGRLHRVVPALKATGIEIKFDKSSSRDRTRLITIRKVENPTVQTVRTVQTGSNGQTGAENDGRSSDGCVTEDGAYRPQSFPSPPSDIAVPPSSDGTSDGRDGATVRRDDRGESKPTGPSSCSCRQWRRRRLRGANYDICDTCHPAPDPEDPRWEYFDSRPNRERENEQSRDSTGDAAGGEP